MGIIFDIIIVLIIILSIYIGYKRGIVDVGIKLFSIIVSLLASLILCGPITNFVIDNTEIDEKIEQMIVVNFSAKSDSNNDSINGINEYIQNYAKNIAQDTQKTLVQNTAHAISINVVKAGVMIVLFIVIRIVFIILQVFTDILTKIPIIKQLNEFGGIIYSLLKAFIIIYVALIVLFYITTISGNLEISKLIEETYVTKLLYNFLF